MNLKKIAQTSIISLSIALAGVTNVIAKELKIGVVDVRQVVSASDQAKEIGETLKKEFKPKEDEILKLEKKFQEQSEKLQRNAAVMSESEKSKLEREVMTMQRDLQRMQNEFREDGSMRQREEMQKFLERVRVEVEKLAETENYDLILHSDAAPFASKKVDITSQVIKHFSTKN